METSAREEIRDAVGGLDLERASFGATLRSRRMARRVSLRRVAALAGLTPSYLSQIERDRIRPPAERVIRRLAAVLVCDAEELLCLAGRLPDDVSRQLRNRPRLLHRLIRSTGRYDDDQIDRICRALEREVPLV